MRNHGGSKDFVLKGAKVGKKYGGNNHVLGHWVENIPEISVGGYYMEIKKLSILVHREQIIPKF